MGIAILSSLMGNSRLEKELKLIDLKLHKGHIRVDLYCP